MGSLKSDMAGRRTHPGDDSIYKVLKSDRDNSSYIEWYAGVDAIIEGVTGYTTGWFAERDLQQSEGKVNSRIRGYYDSGYSDLEVAATLLSEAGYSLSGDLASVEPVRSSNRKDLSFVGRDFNSPNVLTLDFKKVFDIVNEEILLGEIYIANFSDAVVSNVSHSGDAVDVEVTVQVQVVVEASPEMVGQIYSRASGMMNQSGSVDAYAAALRDTFYSTGAKSSKILSADSDSRGAYVVCSVIF